MQVGPPPLVQVQRGSSWDPSEILVPPAPGSSTLGLPGPSPWLWVHNQNPCPYTLSSTTQGAPTCCSSTARVGPQAQSSGVGGVGDGAAGEAAPHCQELRPSQPPDSPPNKKRQPMKSSRGRLWTGEPRRPRIRPHTTRTRLRGRTTTRAQRSAAGRGGSGSRRGPGPAPQGKPS